jgi:acyl carrier protein
VTSDKQPSVATRIREFVRARFPLARDIPAGDEASLLDSGIIDSLGILDLVTFLEGDFGIRVSDEDLNPDNFDSIGALVRFVSQKGGSGR